MVLSLKIDESALTGVALWVGELFPILKGLRFDFQLGHIPSLQV